MTDHPDLPEDWRRTPLAAVATTFGGLTGKTKSDFGVGDARYVPFTSVIGSVRLDGRSLERVTVNASETQNAVRRGDVLLNGSSETPEEVALAAAVSFDPEPNVYLNSFCFGLRPLRDAPIDSMFLAYALRGPVGRALVAPLAQGATRYNIAKTKLLRVPFPLPSIAEQRAIVAVLTDADDLVASLERAIAKKYDVRTGLAQQLLTGRTRLPGFSEEWRHVRAGGLGTFLKGRGITRSDVLSSGVPCVRYGEIYTTFGDHTDRTVSFVDAAIADQSQALRYGDLLFAGSGETRDEIGMCVAWTGREPAVAGGDIVILRGDGYNPVFMAALMNSTPIAEQKARAGQGDAVVHLYARAIADIELTVPRRDEQDAIAQVLTDADAEIELLQTRLEKAKLVREGMMQELLTGRTRLPVAGEVAA